jgi:hypothetical protein
LNPTTIVSSIPERTESDRLHYDMGMRALVWQFSERNEVEFLFAVLMDPDKADCYVDVAFLELLEYEFRDAIAVQDFERLIISVALAAVLIRMKCGGDCVKDACSG